MLKMGLPLDAVKHAMKRDEKDPAILDLDHDKSLKSQQNQDDGPPLREDPEYVKVRCPRLHLNVFRVKCSHSHIFFYSIHKCSTLRFVHFRLKDAFDWPLKLCALTMVSFSIDAGYGSACWCSEERVAARWQGSVDNRS
jgi:hypothetical protein